MARDKLTEYSATASENTVCGDVNIAENSALPSDMNNFAREVMSHLKAFSDGTDAIDALDVTGAVTVGGAFTSQGIDDNATSTAMTLDASGNLLVGTTNTLPAANNVEGVAISSGSFGGFISCSRDGDLCSSFNRKTSDGTIMEFRKDGSTVGSISTFGSRIVLADSPSGVTIDDTDNTFRTINASNGGARDGATDLGNASNRWKNIYLSGGVYLGGAGSANKLSDYETGTWSPVLVGDSVSPTYTEDSVFGATYVKIGAVVHIWFDLNMDITNAGSGQARISGLPFAPDHGSEQGYSAVQFRATTATNLSTGDYLTGWVYNVNTNIYLEKHNVGTGNATWTTGNNRRITGWASYQTTS